MGQCGGWFAVRLGHSFWKSFPCPARSFQQLPECFFLLLDCPLPVLPLQIHLTSPPAQSGILPVVSLPVSSAANELQMLTDFLLWVTLGVTFLLQLGGSSGEYSRARGKHTPQFQGPELCHLAKGVDHTLN